MDYWKEVPYFNSTYSFKWQPVSKGFRFEQLSYSQKQMINHFEGHAEITTKDALFRNMLGYAQGNKLNVFDYVPLTFVIDLDEDSHCPVYDKFTQCYNIFDAASKGLAKGDAYDAVLKQINTKFQNITFSRDKRAMTNCKAKLHETFFAGKNLWILKPTGFNRGRGVSVFDSIEKLKSLIKEYAEGVPDEGQTIPGSDATSSKEVVNPDNNYGCISNLHNLPSVVKTKTFVVQKYLEKPMLIQDRKFDIRCWILVTDDMKVYFFKEGYLRTSSSLFTMDSDAISKRDVHLTNNAVQKNCGDYGKFEDGNQMSFKQFQVKIAA